MHRVHQRSGGDLMGVGDQAIRSGRRMGKPVIPFPRGLVERCRFRLAGSHQVKDCTPAQRGNRRRCADGAPPDCFGAHDRNAPFVGESEQAGKHDVVLLGRSRATNASIVRVEKIGHATSSAERLPADTSYGHHSGK